MTGSLSSQGWWSVVWWGNLIWWSGVAVWSRADLIDWSDRQVCLRKIVESVGWAENWKDDELSKKKWNGSIKRQRAAWRETEKNIRKCFSFWNHLQFWKAVFKPKKVWKKSNITKTKDSGEDHCSLFAGPLFSLQSPLSARDKKYNCGGIYWPPA